MRRYSKKCEEIVEIQDHLVCSEMNVCEKSEQEMKRS